MVTNKINQDIWLKKEQQDGTYLAKNVVTNMILTMKSKNTCHLRLSFAKFGDLPLESVFFLV